MCCGGSDAGRGGPQTGPEPRSTCRQALCSQVRSQPPGASSSLAGKNTERNDTYSLRVRFEVVGTRHLDQSPGCPAMRGTHDPPGKTRDHPLLAGCWRHSFLFPSWLVAPGKSLAELWRGPGVAGKRMMGRAE